MYKNSPFSAQTNTQSIWPLGQSLVTSVILIAVLIVVVDPLSFVNTSLDDCDLIRAIILTGGPKLNSDCGQGSGTSMAEKHSRFSRNWIGCQIATIKV